jgi:hypothetical protein
VDRGPRSVCSRAQSATAKPGRLQGRAPFAEPANSAAPLLDRSEPSTGVFCGCVSGDFGIRKEKARHPPSLDFDSGSHEGIWGDGPNRLGKSRAPDVPLP